MNREALLPMNLQLFAESAPPSGTTATGGQAAGAQSPGQGSGTVPEFDYDKLASLIQGKQNVAEDTVLKNYFKQQGLSQEEAGQAIAAFKQQKAAQQPDAAVLQAQLLRAQEETRKAALDKAATMAAIGLGLDVKTVPYVIKMADFSQAVGQDGKINEENIKNALNKVLEDVPALKPQTGTAATGFVQVGASGQGATGQSTEDALKKAFGL